MIPRSCMTANFQSTDIDTASVTHGFRLGFQTLIQRGLAHRRVAYRVQPHEITLRYTCQHNPVRAATLIHTVCRHRFSLQDSGQVALFELLLKSAKRTTHPGRQEHPACRFLSTARILFVCTKRKSAEKPLPNTEVFSCKPSRKRCW